MTLYGSIEAGGTKFVLGVGDGSKLVQRYRFDTTTPDAAVSEIVAFSSSTNWRVLVSVRSVPWM